MSKSLFHDAPYDATVLLSGTKHDEDDTYAWEIAEELAPAAKGERFVGVCARFESTGAGFNPRIVKAETFFGAASDPNREGDADAKAPSTAQWILSDIIEERVASGCFDVAIVFDLEKEEYVVFSDLEYDGRAGAVLYHAGVVLLDPYGLSASDWIHTFQVAESERERRRVVLKQY